MDIEILLLLQEFRNGAGAVLADFLSKMTFLGELNTAIVIMAVVYWCISKDFGTYLLMGWSGNRLVNGTLKVTACVYRPWIRDARIIPYGNTQATATGYSFPSGHSMNAASVFGGVSVRKDLPRILRIVTGMIVAMICFSRVFVGVHTPQDVLVGAAAGLLVMWLTVKLMDWLSKHPEKDRMVMWTGIVLALAVALYARFKSYPADYDAEGKLLVDGMKMANDTFKAVGWCSAFLTGWVLERRYVRFSTDVAGITRVIRLVCGMLGYYAVNLILCPLLKNWIPGAAGTVVSCFVQMFYIVFLFPWWIRLIEKSTGRSQTDLNKN